jgi:hypothetical protein
MLRALNAVVLLLAIGACNAESRTPQEMAEAVRRALRQEGYAVLPPERCGESFYLVGWKTPTDRVTVVVSRREDDTAEAVVGPRTDARQAALIYRGILRELSRRP